MRESIQSWFWKTLSKRDKLFVLYHIYSEESIINEYVKKNYEKLPKKFKEQFTRYIKHILRTEEKVDPIEAYRERDEGYKRRDQHMKEVDRGLRSIGF